MFFRLTFISPVLVATLFAAGPAVADVTISDVRNKPALSFVITSGTDRSERLSNSQFDQLMNLIENRNFAVRSGALSELNEHLSRSFLDRFSNNFEKQCEYIRLLSRIRSQYFGNHTLEFQLPMRAVMLQQWSQLVRWREALPDGIVDPLLCEYLPLFVGFGVLDSVSAQALLTCIEEDPDQIRRIASCRILSSSPEVPIRVAVAGSQLCDRSLLTALAKHPEIEVRDAVSRNPNAPESALDSLSRDASPSLFYPLRT